MRAKRIRLTLDIHRVLMSCTSPVYRDNMPQLLRVPDVAKQLSLSVGTVYQLIESRKLGHYKINHSVRVSVDQLAAFLAEKKREPVDRKAARRTSTRRRPLKFL